MSSCVYGVLVKPPPDGETLLAGWRADWARAEAGSPRMRGFRLFEPALPLGVDEPPAVLDEFAPSVSLGARDGELGLKLGINRLVAEDNGVGVPVWLASGVGDGVDGGGHPAGQPPGRKG